MIMAVRSPHPRRRRSVYGLIACLLLLLAAAPAAAQAAAGSELVVGVHEAPPFVIREADGSWSGLSVELVRLVAADLGRPVRLRPARDLDALLAAVASGEVDLAAAALTITLQRERMVDFTHPFHVTGLAIAVPHRGESSWAAVARRFLSVSFLRVLAVWGGVLLLVGFLVWVFEHRRNPDFHGESAWRGILEGFWFSAVTMTTVGYGDKAPRTPGGRIVTLVWMFSALIVISSFTAAIASTLTVGDLQGGIRGPDDLPGRRIGTVPLSTSAAYLARNGITSRAYPSTREALEGLARGEVEAVVYDEPMLRYLVRGEGMAELEVLPATFEPQAYGIALPTGSPMREALNRALLRHTHSDVWRALTRMRIGGG